MLAKRICFYFNVRSAVCRIMVAMQRKEARQIAVAVCDSPYPLRDTKAVDALSVRSSARHNRLPSQALVALERFPFHSAQLADRGRTRFLETLDC